MCGIAGFYEVEGSADDLMALLQRMNRFQAHRGPDGEGFFCEQPVGLAHRRLAIIDESGGAQPMFSADGRYALVYNGEVYNYRALRSELEALGHHFRTASDSEVVLEAYAEWGSSCFDRFNGMWGLAIYDRRDRRLILSRDHFGIKPLYYALLGEEAQSGAKLGLLFASELKPLVFSGRINRRPNDKSIYRYLRYRLHDDNEETFFAGVKQLLPGQALELDAQGLRMFSYTTLVDDLKAASLAKSPRRPYDQAAIQGFYEEFHESVRLRLQSDFPVGTALSGGLDSSSVAALINEMMEHDALQSNVRADSASAATAPTASAAATATAAVGKMQNLFSAVFPHSINDEERYIDAFVHEHADTVAAHKCLPTPSDFMRDFSDFIYTQEQPIISTGPYAQYQVMQMAMPVVKVLLDGQGADEMMAGYIPYYFVYLKQLLRERHFGRFLREALASADKIFRLLRVRFGSRLKGKKAWSMTDFIASEFSTQHSAERYTTVDDNIKLRLVHDLFEYSVPCLLRYEDRNTMRFSMEGRLPFLDFNLVRYIWSLSDEAIIKGSWNKCVLRDAMLPYLPKEISGRRNKIGFTTPEVEWFGHLKDRFLEIFESESFAARPYFAHERVLEAYRAYCQGSGDATTPLFWRLLNVELWLRQFIDAPLPETPAEPPHPRGGVLRRDTTPVPKMVTV